MIEFCNERGCVALADRLYYYSYTEVFFHLDFFGGSYEKLIYGWQRSPGLRANAIPMRFVSFVSLVSLVSLVSVVSLCQLVHKNSS